MVQTQGSPLLWENLQPPWLNLRHGEMKSFVLEMNLTNPHDLLVRVEVVERVLLLLKAPERDLCVPESS